jgi:hypothetical protein
MRLSGNAALPKYTMFLENELNLESYAELELVPNRAELDL